MYNASIPNHCPSFVGLERLPDQRLRMVHLRNIAMESFAVVPHPGWTRVDSEIGRFWLRQRLQGYGGFLKWWYPTTMGFPTKKWSFWGVLGVPPFKETPILSKSSRYWKWWNLDDIWLSTASSIETKAYLKVHGLAKKICFDVSVVFF